VALSLSGGTDSTLLALTLLDLGVRPVCYTYVLAGEVNPDVRCAERLTAAFGLTLVRCEIDQELASVAEAVRRLGALGAHSVVGFQCGHGHLVVAPTVRERVIVNGSGVDGLYGVYRGEAIGGRRNPVALAASRRKHLDNPDDDAMVLQQRIYGERGVRVCYPYRDPDVVRFIVSRSWDELNRPRLKYAAQRDYEPEYVRLGRGYYRPRGSQQLVCGTKGLHQGLLRSPYNRAGHASLLRVYDAICQG